MASGRIVVFTTDGFDADERLIREYVVPEYDRLTGIDGCEGVAFSRATTDEHADRGGVHLTIFGDYEAVVEAERDRWEEFVDENGVEEWTVLEPEWTRWPDEQARLARRLQTLASEMARSYFREFDADERPAPADQFHDDERPLGFWLVAHYLQNQVGYDPQSELDAAYRSMENQLRTLVELGGEEYALGKVRLLRDRLGAIEAELAEIVEPDGEETEGERRTDDRGTDELQSTGEPGKSAQSADGAESPGDDPAENPAEVADADHPIAETDPREVADVDPEELVEMDPEDILRQNLGEGAPSPADSEDGDDDS